MDGNSVWVREQGEQQNKGMGCKSAPALSALSVFRGSFRALRLPRAQFYKLVINMQYRDRTCHCSGELLGATAATKLSRKTDSAFNVPCGWPPPQSRARGPRRLHREDGLHPTPCTQARTHTQLDPPAGVTAGLCLTPGSVGSLTALLLLLNALGRLIL